MITNMDNGSVTGKAYPASLAEAYEMTRLWTIPTQKKAATTTSQPMASELVWWVNRIVSTVDGPRGSRSPSDRTSSPCQSLYCHPTYIHTYIHQAREKTIVTNTRNHVKMMHICTHPAGQWDGALHVSPRRYLLSLGCTQLGGCPQQPSGGRRTRSRPAAA